MSAPLNPTWSKALKDIDWPQRLQAGCSHAHLSRAADKAPADSFQKAALKGAAHASAILEGPAPWLAFGAAHAARACGLASLGTAGAVALAYPVGRLLVGDGVARGTASGGKTSKLNSLRESGILGLPEQLCLRAARKLQPDASPVWRHTLFGAAYGLRFVLAVPRAALGLVAAASALVGAGIGVVSHLVKRAYAALQRMPEQVARILHKLQLLWAQLQQAMHTAQACLHAAERMAGMAEVVRPYRAAATRLYGGLASLTALVSQPPRPPVTSTPSPAATPISTRDVAPSAQYSALTTGALACLRSAAQSAQSLDYGADAIGRASKRIQEATSSVQNACSRLYDAHARTRLSSNPSRATA